MNLRERLLSRPAVYRTFKRAVLPSGALERLVADHFVVEDGGKVLDLGCGYGDLAPLFSSRCSYLGVDHNPGYIERARIINAGTAAEFVVADVADPLVVERGPYDLVMMSGVLHHLSSEAVRSLASTIRPLVSAGGRFVAMEPVFDPNQRLTARLAIASDRGRFVRDEEGYRALLEPAFTDIRTTTVTGVLRMPYTHVVITACP